MPQSYTVTSAQQNGSFQSQYGQMLVWAVGLRDAQGQECRAEVNAKPGTDWLQNIGQQVEGDLTYDQQYGWKFKRAFTESSGGGRGPTPEAQAAMTRCHSQDMAIRTLELAWGMKLTTPFEGVNTGQALMEKITRLADSFDRDVETAKSGGASTAQPQPPQQDPTPQMEPPRTDVPADTQGLPVAAHAGAQSDEEIPF